MVAVVPSHAPIVCRHVVVVLLMIIISVDIVPNAWNGNVKYVKDYYASSMSDTHTHTSVHKYYN